mmetsp:Transcript_42636/g.43196  ORF Transcript_42636/g.43196 Transcript_42636/m.43196 type:complete len:82 (-) Transcript_42636:110-355(-)
MDYVKVVCQREQTETKMNKQFKLGPPSDKIESMGRQERCFPSPNTDILFGNMEKLESNDINYFDLSHGSFILTIKCNFVVS